MVYSVYKAGSPLPPPNDEMEYHMENNPVYMGMKSMAMKSIVGHSALKLQHEYETVDITMTF